MPTPLATGAGTRSFQLLQLSDPHLLALAKGHCRGRAPLPLLAHGIREAQRIRGARPDLLLISGDLCQDESWGGYTHLRELLSQLGLPVALLPGNHDHPALLRAVLGRDAGLAPAALNLGAWQLILLSTHRAGRTDGLLEASQLAWLKHQLGQTSLPLVVALHHPPVPMGNDELDRISLQRPRALLEALAACPRLRLVLFGHVHQHWRAALPGRPDVPLLACPSTLCAFKAVQPCPLGRAGDPGGRWLALNGDGSWEQSLLRWTAPPQVAGVH